MQHSGCAYRLGVVCNDLKSYDEGLGYLKLATDMMQPDTTIMKAITLSQGEGYYLTEHYPEAVEAWKRHLSYNPGSIATYYNIANTYTYLVKDDEQAKKYYQQFLDLARQEAEPNEQLKEMIRKSEEMMKTYRLIEQRKQKTKARSSHGLQ
jgi:tetratricopeptide (TPR) repeat protein